jgi:predicted O-methyltransferase YrrM
MKHRADALLQPAQAAYLDRLQPPRDPLLAEMEAAAAEADVPIADPEVGRLLTVLARATRARRIVEIGTAIGYGALCLARGAPEAEVVTIDRDPAMLARARGYLERAGVAGRVRLVEGAALDAIPALDGRFGLAWVDAAKAEYRRYLDLLLPKIEVGGTLAFDNLLWGGLVADPDAGGEEGGEGEGGSGPDPASADALRAFNGYLMMHPQLASVVLPFGDGVGLAVKTKPLMTELGGPF